MTVQSTFLYSSSGNYEFGRAYALNIGPPGKVNAVQYGTILHPPYLKAAPLRIRFDINKNLFGASANHSKIEIFNLSVLSRQNIKKQYLVQLIAGYSNVLGGDSMAEILFTGNVFYAKSVRSQADIITELECLDGGSAIAMSRINKSYSNTPLINILSDIAKAMAVVTPYQPAAVMAGISLGIPNPTLPSFVADGPCRDVLNTLLDSQGLQWSVQNGVLNIVPKTGYNGNTAILVSSQTGMIGVPSLNNQYTVFTSLLNPKLVPGALISLVSTSNPALNGYFKIQNAHYEGDSHGDKWQVTCECTKQNTVVQNLNLGEGQNFGPAVIA